MKNAYFSEIRDFFVNFNAFTFICESFRVLSAAFVQILLFATCHTWALNKIHGADNHHVLAESAAYKAIAGDIPLETAVVSFWHASSDRFPLLSRLALRYLSVPTNSVDTERSVSQYKTVSAPKRQRLSTSNLANQVIIAKNSKTGIAWAEQWRLIVLSHDLVFIYVVNIRCSEISNVLFDRFLSLH